MKRAKAKPKVETPLLDKIHAMWEAEGRKKHRWFKLEVLGSIRTESRKEAKQMLEQYFYDMFGVIIPLSSGRSFKVGDTRAEIEHVNVKILLWNPFSSAP